MQTDLIRRFRAPLARGLWGACALAIASLALAGCTGAADREAERAGERTREDVRDFRDYLRGRGITIDTRLPDR